MRILVIAPFHVSGTLDLYQRGLRERGHELRFVTQWPNQWGFAEDISLNLPLMPHEGNWIVKSRRFLHRLTRGPLADDTPISERPPMWKSPGFVADSFFVLRDAVIAPYVIAAAREHKFDDYDLIWVDQGAGLFRDARLVRRWAEMGKHMMAFYHGSDMRNRGIFPQVDRHLELRLTSEVDLLNMDNRLKYLFLPFDTDAVTPKQRTPVNDGVIRIAHAARVRAFKGTETVIAAVERLKQRHSVELTLIESMPHEEAMAAKRRADIVVDQVADLGGWGYGMSSVESLALGLPTCTLMRPEMEAFLPDHPFINVTADNLEAELEALATDPKLRKKLGNKGREWVVRRHGIEKVVEALLGYWSELGWV